MVKADVGKSELEASKKGTSKEKGERHGQIVQQYLHEADFPQAVRIRSHTSHHSSEISVKRWMEASFFRPLILVEG